MYARRNAAAAPVLPDCPCCGLPFQPVTVTSIDDAPKTQPACRACMPHLEMRGEDPQRALEREREHARRAAVAVKGAREEAHRLRARDNQRGEQLSAALASRNAAWERLDLVRELHEVVGSKCRCGQAAERCQTLPLLRGYGMPPRNWHAEQEPDEEP